MAEKKITRKVISKAPIKEKALKEEVKAPKVSEVSKSEGKGLSRERAEAGKFKKVCVFCQNKTVASYTDTAGLRRFITDRAKIVSRLKNGLCSKHQRVVSGQIKYARHLALLPFIPKV